MKKELIEKRLRLHTENVAILQKVKADGRDVPNADEEQEWQARDTAIEALTKQIERLTKQDQIDAALSAPEDRRADPNPIAPEPRNGAYGMRQLAQSRQDFETALRGWFLKPTSSLSDAHRTAAQRVGMSLDQREITLNFSRDPLRSVDPYVVRQWEERAPQTITTTGGGYTIPDEMMRSIEKALLYFGPMRQTSTIIRTETGADLPWPTVNDTTVSGAILDINTQWTEQAVTFGQKVFKAFKYTSKPVLVPIELMQDNGVNLPALLGDLLGERIGRIQNTHFTTGAGTTLPFGIVVSAASGLAPAGSVAAGFTYQNLVDFEHSVDIAYRNMGASFMMNDAVVARFKKLLSAVDGRPIWQPGGLAGMATGAPNTLLGYPYFVNNDMSTATTTTTRAVLFGALQKYMIREVISITLTRLDERYADFHQVAFTGVARADGDIINAGTNPIKYMAYTT